MGSTEVRGRERGRVTRGCGTSADRTRTGQNPPPPGVSGHAVTTCVCCLCVIASSREIEQSKRGLGRERRPGACGRAEVGVRRSNAADLRKESLSEAAGSRGSFLLQGSAARPNF